MAKEKDIDIGRLCDAMNLGRLSLRKPREERRELARQSTGSHWNEEGARTKVPFPLVSLYLDIVVRSLISQNPRVMLATFDKSIKPKVKAMEAWANKEIEKMKLANTIQRVVVDSLHSIGIAKVALGTPVDAARFSWAQTAGSAFVEPIDLDDWVHDPHCRDLSQAAFMGHRYRAPLDVVKSFDEYDKKARKELTATTDPSFNEQGDERISVLGRGYYGSNSEEFEDFVDLWEMYLPRHRLIITMAGDIACGSQAGGLMELRRQRFIGPSNGPYYFLPMGMIPGNAMPIAPLQNLVDLHVFINDVGRKLMRQAERQKDVVFVQGGATEDGNRVQEANDGEIIRVDNPEKLKEIRYGGPDAQNFQLFQTALQQFSYFGGNLDMMGGLSPQSKTATQDKMLAENASRSILDKQERTLQFTDDVVSGLCWYWWNDPFKVMQTTYSLPGLPEFTINRQVTPQDRKKARFEDLDLTVDPYSLAHQTPQQRLGMINDVMQKIILPGMQAFQAQGVVPNLNKYLEFVARYGNMPDLGELVTFQQPPDPTTQTGGGSAQPGMPPQTERAYTRNNVSSSTPQAEAKQASANMMAAAGKNGDGG